MAMALWHFFGTLSLMVSAAVQASDVSKGSKGAALGCLAEIYPKEAWPQLHTYADAAALLEKSCRNLGHVGETCADVAGAVFARFGTRMSSPIAADEELCSAVLAAFTSIISTATTLPQEVVEKLQQAEDPGVQSFLDRSKRCSLGACDFGPEDESVPPPKETLRWCPEILEWLHREKRYGPEGYHVICLDDSGEGLKRSGWFFANASAASARRISVPRPWAAFRSTFQRWLQPSSRWELHPWRLFDTAGRPVETVEAAGQASLLLLFEGGEFQYPAVHLGFQRRVALPGAVAKLRTLSLRPVVFSVEGFADAAERRALKKLAKPLLKKSEVRQFDNHEMESEQSFRSSWSAFLPTEDPLVSQIMNRSRELTKVAGRVENLQVMRYRHGQQYQAHWDFFDPQYFKKQPEVLGRLTHRRNRMLTMLFYLASSAGGGQTAFPMAYGAPRPMDPEDCSSWLQVPAKRGKAVLFYNLHADGRLDRSSNHAGCKVSSGEKWSANIWAWNSANQEILDPEYDDEL
ncbi:P4H4 [Symbiodinium natans]|uniref:P4H4 protein n=1 Tax=Symbiodinium natans TaxID=878477 RepID=A0A812UFX1_9DINO|nr:P4H4 [Symbiodinium natans]